MHAFNNGGPMKKLLIILLLASLSFAGTFSFSHTYDGCKNHAMQDCKWSYRYLLPTRDPNYMICAQPIFDYCNCKYRPDLVGQYNVNKDCAALSTKYNY